MIYKLKSLSTIVTGVTPSTKNEKYYSVGIYNFITPSDLKNKKVIRETIRKISEDAFADYNNRFIEENSIVIDCIGSDMGNVAITGCKSLTNQQINSLTKINEEVVNYQYLYYLLSLKKEYFHLIGTNGSTMPIINKSTFENIEIDLPSLEEQKKIVDILSPLDEKIELNNKINKTLEEMAQLLYKQWFIDFEFPNDEGNPFKSAGGRMIYNEELDKEIPEGWKVNKLEKYININTGSLNSEQSEANGIYPFYTRNVITSSINRYTHDTEGVIVAGEGNFLPKYARGKFALHQRTYLLNSKSKLKNELLYFIIKNNVNMILQTSVGSTVRSLRKTTFENILVVLPENLENIEDKIYLNYLDNMINILNENRLLENQKKILLDKYFGGSNE